MELIEKTEYPEYFSRYIIISNGTSLRDQLRYYRDEVAALLSGLSDEDAHYRYEDGKWSVKEVIGHITDIERVFCYRALAFARGEKNPLHSIDHDLYVQNANFDAVSLDSLSEQYKAVRESTMALFAGFSEEDLLRRGDINGSGFTVRALGYIISGHEQHHLNIISERYLPGLE